ncbi:MAG: response regulator [Candidatus Omnitrophota bacterium]|nr:response regulator [Candidatus Omnitrophota bacterium]
MMSASKGNVLIVDDEIEMRRKFKKLLKEDGFDVYEAKDALDVANVLMRDGRKLDLVLLDINIAEINGRDIFDIIIGYSPNVKVIVTSVFPVKDQKLRVPKANDYFNKADDGPLLLKKISDLIGF